MKIIALNGSPNSDGLTATMAQALLDGAAQAGAGVELVHMTDLDLRSCGQCGNGWGRCRAEGFCVLDDDFQALREKVQAADAVIVSTPVYWGECSEVVKNFMDRLRRCECAGPGESPLRGRWALGVAAAGGSGGGIVSCQQALERYFQHTGMRIFDLIPVTRFSRGYKVDLARAAGQALAERVANPE